MRLMKGDGKKTLNENDYFGETKEVFHAHDDLSSVSSFSSSLYPACPAYSYYPLPPH